MAKEVGGDRLAENSRQTYDSATLQYAKFAVALGYEAFPATDEVLSQWLRIPSADVQARLPQDVPARSAEFSPIQWAGVPPD
jgi:hypothetical protein